MWLLAVPQPNHANQATSSVMIWVVVLMVVVAVAFGTLLLVRRWLGNMGKADDNAPTSMAFTMADLRKLRDQGQLTDIEFERARASMLAHHRAATPDEPEAPMDQVDQVDSQSID